MAAVADAEGYLVRVVTRLAIDRLRSARVHRESYVGPWLRTPDPGYQPMATCTYLASPLLKSEDWPSTSS